MLLPIFFSYALYIDTYCVELIWPMLNDKWNGHIIAGNLGSNFYGWRWEEVVGKCFTRHWQSAFCLAIWQVLWFAFIPCYFIIYSFRSQLLCVFNCLQLCTFAQFWLCVWLPDGDKSQFYWLVSLYLEFISNYYWSSLLNYFYIEWQSWSLYWISCFSIFIHFYWLSNIINILSTYIIFYLLVSFYDPGPHGNFRYSQNMLPEVTEADFRKGSQVSLQFSYCAECLLIFLYTNRYSDWMVSFDL